MKPRYYLILTLLLAGCGEREVKKPEFQWVTDQCLRAELFKTCLNSVPPGPNQTHYNDWEEVIETCDQASYRMSIRKSTFVKPECAA